ncbi:hydrolase, TatD family [Ancylostoma ceylanicum]|uniref:Hydrolase, TatD family n=1 Tax=Ancylostoma ceylanicum TaxID=53326 RepID=A0A0D6MAL1_9BILA|nr:hydrolase, TatD family [Ancylostoma ceylanicum]
MNYQLYIGDILRGFHVILMLVLRLGYAFEAHKKNKSVKASDIEGVEAFLEKHRHVIRTVHSRAATGDTIDFLVESNADRVALHAFNGNLEEVLRGVTAGFFFSIPPSFTTGDHKRFLLEAVPMEKLLLETDSPVLGPVRGERNEPANLKLSAEYIAEVKNLPLQEVISITTANALKLLGIQNC